jgi:type IV pilus assembly protein PilA
VDSARDAMRAQAEDLDRRALASDAVRRATMFRVALTEYFQTNGRWPRSVEDAGLPSPDEMRGPGVKSISLGERGAVIVLLDDALAANGKVVLRPNVNTATGIVDWSCELEGDANLKTLLPRCERAR